MLIFFSEYMAGYACLCLSLRYYVKKMKKIDKDAVLWLLGMSLIPYFGYLFSVILLAIPFFHKMGEYMERKKLQRKKEKRKSFMEHFLGAKETGEFYKEYHYVEQQKEKIRL